MSLPEPRLISQAGPGKFSAGSIHGVVVKPIAVHDDPRGALYEAFREDELIDGHRPVMAYASWTRPGVVRGPHEHYEQADYFVFAGPSDFKVVCWDNRPASPTYGRRLEFAAGASRPVSVLVPPGVVHAYENIGKLSGFVLNFPDRLFAGRGKKEAVDEIRYETMKDAPFVMISNMQATKKTKRTGKTKKVKKI